MERMSRSLFMCPGMRRAACSILNSTRLVADKQTAKIMFRQITLPHLRQYRNIHNAKLFRNEPFSRGLLRKSWQTNLIFMRSASSRFSNKNTTTTLYVCAIGVFMIGMTYAGVPLYRMFCQATGLGGQAVQGHDTAKVETMQAQKNRQIKIKFNADTASSMQWSFRPQQSEIKVVPGETALAFYTATNPTAKPIIGISTYNVLPFEAGQYFNKIQCFCFEEQRLNSKEQVDMPVFFYIDPEFADDPKMDGVRTITLSYTFFEAKEGMTLPLPGYMQPLPKAVQGSHM